MTDSIFQLKCSCNNYPWGKQGSKSLAARLAAKTPETDFQIDEAKTYAEMWMGTYPDLPTYVLSTGKDLQELLNEQGERLIGKKVIDKFGHQMLPFLPKVLSIQKALPLQLHPDRELSEKLHKENPSDFTDPNHKPEIALALSEFEAFAGFKPLDRIQRLLKQDYLKVFLPNDGTGFTNETLRQVVKTMLTSKDADIAHAVKGLECTSEDDLGEDRYMPSMATRLKEQYDVTDPGILVALITMNYLELKPGECISVPADGIHAWLSGDIIECMARSNNVLNTGFCPSSERNSADLFTSCLTFNPHSENSARLTARKFSRSANGKASLYQTEMSEFDVLAIELREGEEERLDALGGPSIILIIRGKGVLRGAGKDFAISEGYVFFAAHNTELEIRAQNDLSAYIAYVE